MKKFAPLAILFAVLFAVTLAVSTASASDIAHRYGRGHYPAPVHGHFQPGYHHGPRYGSHHVRPLPPPRHYHHRSVVVPCPGGLHIVTPRASIGIHF